MSWKPKQSAKLTIEQRPEPYLTEALKNKITNEIMPRYATGQGALMTALHEVQHEYGYIPWQAMVEIAHILSITPAQVADVVSFYEDYHSEPMGKYIFGICQSIACEVCGHKAVVDHIKQTLKVDVHGTTEDGMFSLLTMECLGSCDNAPCALVNGIQHDKLTIAKVDQLITECKNKS